MRVNIFLKLMGLVMCLIAVMVYPQTHSPVYIIVGVVGLLVFVAGRLNDH